MHIKIDDDRRVSPKNLILGNSGEVASRAITVDAPEVSGAVLYVMRFAVPSGIVYETEISGGSVTVPAAVLAETGCGLMQWVARSSTGQLIAKSETVGYAVMQSVGDETSTLPAPEDTQSAIDRIKEAADEAIGSISGLVPEDGSIQEVIDARAGCFSDYTYASLQQRLNAELGSCVRQNAFEQTVSALSIKDTELETEIAAARYGYVGTAGETRTLYSSIDDRIMGDLISIWNDHLSLRDNQVAGARRGYFNSEQLHSTLAGRLGADFGAVSGMISALQQDVSNNSALTASSLGMQKKNLLKNTASTATTNGVTFTVNSDGSVTANGTATEAAFFNIPYTHTGEARSVILTGCPSGGSGDTYMMRADKAGTIVARDYGSGVTISAENIATVTYVAIRINAGYTADNLTFYPMIRYADISDGTYETYTPSLQEQIDELKAQIAAMTTAAATTETEE